MLKKLIFLAIVSVLALFAVACGGDSEGDDVIAGNCESRADCPLGYECNPVKHQCYKPGSGGGGGGEDLPDSGADSGEMPGDTGSTPDSGETSEPDTGDTHQDVTGNCNPGDTQKCDYEGPAGTEGVGVCKAARRTCKENETWGPCTGAVLPVIESGELCSDGLDNDCDGLTDQGGYCGGVDTGDTSDTGSDSGIIDVGYTGNYSDAYQVPQGEGNPDGCVDECVPIQAECMPMMTSEYPDYCDGLDNDCDGEVDEGCPCSPGQTQPCFMGPPNYRGVGACSVDGVQTCIVNLKDGKAVSGKWGECVGGMKPTIDVCDHSDNNCNGCVDDQLCCQPPIDCSYDIGTALPFNDKIIDGSQFYNLNDGDQATWTWTLSKGPCDTVLNKTSFAVKGGNSEAALSGTGAATTVVSGVGMKFFKVNFTLSGSYTLNVKILGTDGQTRECTWVIRVVSAGFRVELCWDKTGTLDIDLHLAKVGTTSGWTNGACYYGNCKNTGQPNWGYPTTINSILNQSTLEFEHNKTAYNPRLDLDNISKPGIPENINLDNPNNGDTFRIGVNYYSSSSTTTHPVINVYCGGTLKSTFGVEPQVSGFNGKSKLWKVAEVKWVGDFNSDACEITPKFTDSGYVVGTLSNYDW